MSVVGSKILMIGNWNPAFAEVWGADLINTLNAAEDREYDVILLSMDHLLQKDFQLVYGSWKKKAHSCN